MNVKELKQILIEKKVRPLSYNLVGKWENDEYCLGFNGDNWEVYYSERGQKDLLKTFLTEEEACMYYYEWAVKALVMNKKDKNLISYADGRFLIFSRRGEELGLIDMDKRRILGEECKYTCKQDILYVRAKYGYIVINLLNQTIKQLEKIPPNKFVWGGDYGEEYQKINEFDEFSEKEQQILNSL